MVNEIFRTARQPGNFCRVDGFEGLNLPAFGAPVFL
jgi:hypothetical protein